MPYTLSRANPQPQEILFHDHITSYWRNLVAITQPLRVRTLAVCAKIFVIAYLNTRKPYDKQLTKCG